jgi:hypothetical protein
VIILTQNELKTAFDAVDQDMVNDKVMMNLAMEVAQKALTPDGKIRPAEELLPLMVDTISNYNKDFLFRILSKVLCEK